MIHFRFSQGLGDCANAAHLFALYTSRGYRIAVDCDKDKAALFEAAGCELKPDAERAFQWHEQPVISLNALTDVWSENRTGRHLSKAPLPEIGDCSTLWQELSSKSLDLESFLTVQVELDVARIIQKLPRPLILFAPQGNTGTEDKDLSHEVQAQFLRGILDLTNGSVVQLDWDQRVLKMSNWRIRHLQDDWKLLNTIELYCLLKQADLIVGCDSGILHFARFTATPAIGIWTRHHPCHFAIPRTASLHIVPGAMNELNRANRTLYNVIECPGDLVHGRFVAEHAARLLGSRRYLYLPVVDVMLRHLVDQCRQADLSLTYYQDRHRTFDAFLLAAARKGTPCLVETGTIRASDDWTAGYSTYLFAFFLHHHGGGHLFSIDLDPKNIQFASSMVGQITDAVSLHCEDSREWISKYSGQPIDFLYLDSADVGSEGFEECCLQETQAAYPKMASDGLILIDDTYWESGRFSGKGALAIPWLLERGWTILIAGYQVLLARVDMEVPTPDRFVCYGRD